MAEYTYADVIIDPDDPRVEIGKEYYFGNYPKALLYDISRGLISQKLTEINHDASFCPFVTEDDDNNIEDGSCIIRKKEPKKKYVPFDLTKEEDRAKLRGKWVRKKEAPFIEQEIAGLSTNVALVFLNDVVSVGVANLLEEYEFVDGSPCGVLVEEEI